MIDGVRQVARQSPTGAPTSRRILVLGDAGADMCQALAADGHDVTCCPDSQRRPGAHHVAVGARTVAELVSSDDGWDLLVAAEGFSRIQVVHPGHELDRLLGWAAAHATVALLEAPRRALTPDDESLCRVADLGRHFRYVTELGSRGVLEATIGRPLLVASDQYLLVNDEWIADAAITPLSRGESGVSEAVRTFAVGDHIVKVESASEQYFERCQALQEAAFLSTMPEGLRVGLALPAIRWVQRGRSVSVVVRERVPGAPVGPGICSTGQPHVRLAVDACVQMAAAGIFHNDLRPWNLLWDGVIMRPVDWADAGSEDLDNRGLPQVMALAGTVAGLMNDQVPWGESFLGALETAVARSGVLNRWPRESLRGGPWLALPRAAESLISQLESVSGEPEQIVKTVIDAVMRSHEAAA